MATVQELIHRLKDPDWSVQYAAASALGEIGPGAKEVVPALVAALKDEDAQVRNIAAWALGKIGRPS